MTASASYSTNKLTPSSSASSTSSTNDKDSVKSAEENRQMQKSSSEPCTVKDKKSLFKFSDKEDKKKKKEKKEDKKSKKEKKEEKITLPSKSRSEEKKEDKKEKKQKEPSSLPSSPTKFKRFFKKDKDRNGYDSHTDESSEGERDSSFKMRGILKKPSRSFEGKSSDTVIHSFQIFTTELLEGEF